MSAAEIIEQIRLLPKSEQMEVLEYLEDVVEHEVPVTEGEVDAALKKVFKAYDADFKMLAQ